MPIRSTTLSAALSGLRRGAIRVTNAVRGLMGGTEQQRISELVPNPTLNIMLVATWTSPDGEIKRMGHHIRPQSTSRRQLLANLFYQEVIDLANAFGDEKRQRALIRGLDSYTRREATRLGALVPKSAAPARLSYECELGAELSPLVPAGRLTAIDAGARASLVVNRRAHLQIEPTLPAALAGRVLANSVTSRRLPILWIEDPGTEIIIPYRPSDDILPTVTGLFAGTISPASVPPEHVKTLAEAWLLVPSGWEEQRIAQWQSHLAEARQSLEKHQYAVLTDLFNPVHLGSLRAYFGALVAGGYLNSGDRQVARRDWSHNEPICRSLHDPLAQILNRFAPEPLKASYTYLASYHEGAELPRHTDREQCAWNMSLALDSAPGIERDTAWPIYLEIDGSPRAVRLAAGEAVVYRGTTIPHWREPLPAGHKATVCFYHFVPRDFTGSLR